MVTINAVNIEMLPEEFENTIKQFHQFILSVTDRLSLVTKEKDELGWGNTVLTLAVQGKLCLLQDLITENKLSLKNETSSFYETLLQTWLGYISDFKDDFNSSIVKQAKYSIEERMLTHFNTKTILTDPNDFDQFRDERDTIELFFIGIKSMSFNIDNIRISLMNTDEALRKFIREEIMPVYRKQENIYLAIKRGNRRWLPETFWWRHVE